MSCQWPGRHRRTRLVPVEKLYKIDKRKPLVWFVFVVNDDLEIAMIAVVTNVAFIAIISNLLKCDYMIK